ncbi:MAG TPA: hypothetical protein VFO94_20130, partial [Gammaproteobacteria bacterium]|nr:hypothetical protein [Gammaproteobacteria bacterium]
MVEMLRLTIPRTGPRPGPITDPQAVRTCTHAGISLVQGKLAALTDVEKGLVAADAELATAMDRKAVIDGALLGLKWTKAACDGFISIASEFAGPAGKVVAGGYKVGGSVAEAVSTAAAGQPVNWTKTTTGV